MQVVSPDVVPDTLPQQLDDRFCAEWFQHTGAAKLQKPQAGMRGDQRRNVELILSVESTMRVRHVLAKQTIRADQFAVLELNGISLARSLGPHDDEVVADGVEAVMIALRGDGVCIRTRAKFFIKDSKAQSLAGFDLVCSLRLTEDQVAAFGPDIWCLGQVNYSNSACLPQTRAL